MDDDDPATAFDLAARAAAGGVADRILLLDHVVAADVGAFEPERGAPQRLAFDIVAEVAPVAAGDDVDRILSYDRLAECVAEELAGPRAALLETLAQRLAARLLREPQASRVFLRIRKLDRGAAQLGVEVVRARPPGPLPAPAADAPPPAIVVLPPGAPPPEPLPGRALLLAAAASPGPDAATAAARRRIALLALDQAAWALAARDPRLQVVASLTEIRWAARRDVPAAWAPARLAADAPDLPADPARLAGWLAERLA